MIRFLLLALATGFLTGPVGAQTTARASVSSIGGEANSVSWEPSVSANGRFVAFTSVADNLVPSDTNGARDVFVHDFLTGQTRRVSVPLGGGEANGDSESPSISDNGGSVAFVSDADNLVPGDTNGASDVFVHNLVSGLTRRVSVDSLGIQGNSGCRGASISSSGGSVAFGSRATNLVPGDTNGAEDIFVHNRTWATTRRVSVDSLGVQGNGHSFSPWISGDGSVIAFDSLASNFVLTDTNGVSDVFVHYSALSFTTRVSRGLGGQSNAASYRPSLSWNGRVVAFHSDASNLVAGDTNGSRDAFVYDIYAPQIRRVSVDAYGRQAQWGGDQPSISANGRHVAFRASDYYLVPGAWTGMKNVFVKDLLTGETVVGNLSYLGGLASGGQTESPSLSRDGRQVAFMSHADNLVPGDTNAEADIFVRDLGAPELTLALQVPTGACPGPNTLSIYHAGAGNQVAVVYGPAGTFFQANPPCVGVVLGVSTPTIGLLLGADAAGHASQPVVVPANACGLSLQAVDLAACSASNVLPL